MTFPNPMGYRYRLDLYDKEQGWIPLESYKTVDEVAAHFVEDMTQFPLITERIVDQWSTN